MTSPCGKNCGDCGHYPAVCEGCRAIRGEVYWAGYLDDVVCPIYECAANEKGLFHCGECQALPCSLYFDAGDPNMTEQETVRSVDQQVRRLGKMGRSTAK